VNEFREWLLANGFDPEAVTDEQRVALQAAWRSSLRGEDPVPTPPPPEPGAQPPVAGNLEAIAAAARRENERRNRITSLVATALQANPDRVDQLERIGRLAIDGNWDAQRTELELLRAGSGNGPTVYSRSEPEANGRVLEAAVCIAGGLESLDKHYDDRTLTAAERQFRGGLGLQDLVGIFARRGGWRGVSLKAAFNSPSVLRAAFRVDGDGVERHAGVSGPSTYSLPTILSNVANKFLRVGFEAVDDAWRRVAAVRSVTDFKQITTAALTGSLIYKKLPPGGEIEHGEIGDRSYTNQADSYARMIGIDRRDLINDDLGALTSAGRRLGRGAALKLNDIFWTAFLNNSTFFSAGNNNVITGGTSVLSLSALQLADEKFKLQTDPDGQPLGVMPTILLVPSSLRITALNLMNATTVVATNTGTSTTLSPNSNVFAGAYDVVSSPYMQNSSYTGNSSTAWYLLASPADMPVIEVVFLNGVQTPTVETTEADFNTLGIALRGFFDAGVSLQEFRGGVRAAGA
jgi:hypothetical protein